MFFFGSCVANAQHTTVSADKMNILYAAIDNPLTIVSENCPCNKLIVKSNLGSITSDGSCQFLFKSSESGGAEISVYKKNDKGLKKLNTWFFRVKNIPNPVFRIGPYGGESCYRVYSAVIAAQEFVRADLENFDFDVRFHVDSFRVNILNNDSCRIKRFTVNNNHVPNEVREEFTKLKESDFIVVNKIYATGPDGLSRHLDPLTLTIEKNVFKRE